MKDEDILNGHKLGARNPQPCLMLESDYGQASMIYQVVGPLSSRTFFNLTRHRWQQCKLRLFSPTSSPTKSVYMTHGTSLKATIAVTLLLLLSLAYVPLNSNASEAQQSRFKANNVGSSSFNGRSQASQLVQGNPAIIPQNWARSTLPEVRDESSNEQPPVNSLAKQRSPNNRSSGAAMKSARHIINSSQQSTPMRTNSTSVEDICADRLCYGLPNGCLGGVSPTDQPFAQPAQAEQLCSVLVTSKRFIDPNRPISRDILFELIALPMPGTNNYAAVGFSETGRMQGLVSECIQYRDPKTELQIITLRHSYNIAGVYTNVPAKILSGIKNLGVSFENGYYQCRWIVESAVEFSYEELNGTSINRRDDLGYKNYHILLASGEFLKESNSKGIHTLRVSSMTPVSLAQTGHIKSLGSHILIRIHGSLMIAIWVGLVTLSIILARYYKNEWSDSKINDLAIWFVVHRTLMLTSWFGSLIAVIFAYMYTETYHPGLHQISGTTCLAMSTIQVLGGVFRPSQESNKRVYFNWTHFVCGNLSYLCAMICLITAAFLAPVHLPPLYIWVIVVFVGAYVLTHFMMTIHQYIAHKSSKISITPMSDLNSNSSATYTSCGFIADSYPKEVNSPFRQFMLGILVTVIVIFIVLLISLVNIK